MVLTISHCESVTELRLLFVHPRPHTIDSIKLCFAGTLQELFEVTLSGVASDRILNDGDAPVQIRFGLHLAIRLGDSRREGLPVLFLDVDFQRLKEGVFRVFCELGCADGKGSREISRLQLVFCLRVSALHALVLGADFVIKILIIRGAFGSCRIGHAAIQIQDALQLAQRRTDIAALIGDDRRLVQLLFFLARARVFLFQTPNLREHLEGSSILRPELENAL